MSSLVNYSNFVFQDRSSASINRKHHWLLEQKLLHFVDAFHHYVMDRVFILSLIVIFLVEFLLYLGHILDSMSPAFLIILPLDMWEICLGHQYWWKIIETW